MALSMASNFKGILWRIQSYLCATFENHSRRLHEKIEAFKQWNR